MVKVRLMDDSTEHAIDSTEHIVDLLSRIVTFLHAEFAHIEGCACVRLKLFVTRPTYASGPIKVWDREDVLEAFVDIDGTPMRDLGYFAVDILQGAKNFAESFEGEESWHFEVHAWQRLGSQSKISFQLPASPSVEVASSNCG